MDGSFTDQFLAHLTDSAQVGGVWQYAWTEQIIDQSTGLASDAPGARTGTTSIGWVQEINNRAVQTPFYAWIRLRTLLLGAPVYEFSIGTETPYIRLTGNPGASCGYLEGVLQVKTTVGGCVKYVDGPTVQVLDLNAASGSG